MNEITIYLIGIGITVCVSLLVTIYLKLHLKKILTDLCGTEIRANFWAAFSSITMMLVPLIFAMFHNPQTGKAASGFFDVIEQFRMALIGLIATVVFLGFVIGRFIITLEKHVQTGCEAIESS